MFLLLHRAYYAAYYAAYCTAPLSAIGHPSPALLRPCCGPAGALNLPNSVNDSRDVTGLIKLGPLFGRCVRRGLHRVTGTGAADDASTKVSCV